MPNNHAKWAFVFRDSRDTLDGPMMRLWGRSAPLFVRAGGQAGNHLGNQAREGPPGANGKPLAGPETNRAVRGDESVGLTRARGSLHPLRDRAGHHRRAHAREGFTYRERRIPAGWTGAVTLDAWTRSSSSSWRPDSPSSS